MGESTKARDDDCVELLQWALPRLGLRWRGFRKVRRQVCRRIRRRMNELEERDGLGLDGFGDYRALLETDEDEWATLERLCRVTISRFLRDREVYRRLCEEVLPELAERAAARGARRLRAWSVGCASGEEPYSLSLGWRFGAAAVHGAPAGLWVLATDVDLTVLARARRRCYQASSLREVPADWRERAFERRGELWCLRGELARDVALAACDVRAALPRGTFDLILCRNLVFTYLDEAEQVRVGRALLERLELGGVLVVGSHETVPAELQPAGVEPFGPCVYRRRIETRPA
ncbi:MAG TPA: CheR family methyltransferase [Thermoanaerobaculia bacterium]|nr:CheR family methyltransferase [Thermoanaerobaculia bacterium]